MSVTVTLADEEADEVLDILYQELKNTRDEKEELAHYRTLVTSVIDIIEKETL